MNALNRKNATFTFQGLSDGEGVVTRGSNNAVGESFVTTSAEHSSGLSNRSEHGPCTLLPGGRSQGQRTIRFTINAYDMDERTQSDC